MLETAKNMNRFEAHGERTIALLRPNLGTLALMLTTVHMSSPSSSSPRPP